MLFDIHRSRKYVICGYVYVVVEPVVKVEKGELLKRIEKKKEENIC